MRPLLIFMCVVLISSIALGEEDAKKIDRPPYGVKFGQKFDASEHATITRRGNVRSVKLRTADRPDDTEDLQAEICEEFGLQVLTWRSYIRSKSAAAERHKEISREMTEKYGKPKTLRRSAFWKAKGFHIVVKIRNKAKIYQNQIRYFGPKNEPCFEKLMIHQQKNR
ncbi:MAG: hypothetical protein HON14_19370 [Rhodospirillaceae bacterium]|jgi:hypothetical protein|nr:hypothetical protein [Rhodospirillaceae bacterium]MBT4589428.1 hypothetical protein [Rhodospirillaceae bacterium]MBT4941309.1 hypothetical protein [Rhodospirillaceae bacterium]MBT7265902.1 hypothetical protein [Rhodospirillaceae bacterium]